MSSLYETIETNFLEPFFEGLTEQFEQEKDLVKLLMSLKCATGTSLSVNVLEIFLEKTEIDDNVLLSLEAMWKVVNGKLGLEKLYPENYPSQNEIKKFCIEYFIKKILDHFQTNIKTLDVLFDCDKNNLQNKLDLIVKYYIKYPKLDFLVEILSSYSYIIHHLINKSLVITELSLKNILFGNDFNGQTIFYGLNFSNKNLNPLLPIHKIKFILCNFQNAQFNGDGSTGTCAHWHVETCDFTNCKFIGNFCCKMSKWKNCNLSCVDLTGVTNYNFGMAEMINCDLSDAYMYDSEGNKLMGKHMMRFLKNSHENSCRDNYYLSPDDGGYDEHELDPNIWVDL